MKNFPFSYGRLASFSDSLPYKSFSSQEIELYKYLKNSEQSLNFPAVKDDVGAYLGFITKLCASKVIFEFGSGYGQSAFWYLQEKSSVEKIYLCEKRLDLRQVFEQAPWSDSQRSKLDYYQGDAFERLEDITDIDFLLIDGVKANYLEFLQAAHPRLKKGALVAIDNSFWRGSFLDPEQLHHRSALKIKEMHAAIATDSRWEAVFLPFEDGLTLLRKLS